MYIGFVKLMLDNKLNEVADNSLNMSVACALRKSEMRFCHIQHVIPNWLHIQDAVLLFFLHFFFSSLGSRAILSVTITSIVSACTIQNMHRVQLASVQCTIDLFIPSYC